jgi:4-amino-4-deoxy-L-arabinose transferase-like glycosyltransferase
MTTTSARTGVAARVGAAQRSGRAALARPSLLLCTAIAVFLALAGTALRVRVLSSPRLGALDSDEAVAGLMARHALHGEFSVFFWLQAYGGTQQVLADAAVFALFGAGRLALELVSVVLYAAAAVLVWRVGRRTVGEPAARLAAGLFWTSPAFFVWWSTKAYGYGFSLLCATAALLLVLRLSASRSRTDAALLGLVLGLGWWATPMVAVVAVPALAWLVLRARGALRPLVYAVPAFLLCASPWLAWNVRYDWLSLRLQPAAGATGTFLGRLRDLFAIVLPTWLGVRAPLTLEWIAGRAVGALVVAVALGAFLVLRARRTRELELLVLIAALFPFFYALSPFAGYVKDPRYLVVVSPVLALLLARLLARWTVVAVAGAVLVVASSAVGLDREDAGYRAARGADVPIVADDFGPLVSFLEAHDADRVLANYWIAYRLTFESGEDVIASSTGFVRYVPYDRLVHACPFPTYVFGRGTDEEPRARPALLARNYERARVDGFTVYRHAHPCG